MPRNERSKSPRYPIPVYEHTNDRSLPIIKPVQYIKHEFPEESAVSPGALEPNQMNQVLSKEREMFAAKLSKLRDRLNRGSIDETAENKFTNEQDVAAGSRAVE